MKHFLHIVLAASIVVMFISASCSTTRTVHTWKDESYAKKLQSVLIICVAELDFMREHFENVLSNRLSERGVKAVASHTLFPDSSMKLTREAVAAKIRELGIGSVLVARVLSKDEHSHLISGGYYAVPVSFVDGWYNTYATAIVPVSVPGSAYDAEHFNILANVFDSSSEKLVWSDLLRVKVEQSRQGAINPLIEVLLQHMEAGRMI